MVGEILQTLFVPLVVAAVLVAREVHASRRWRDLHGQGEVSGTVVGTHPVQVSEHAVRVGHYVDYLDTSGQNHRLEGALCLPTLPIGHRVTVRFPESDPSAGEIYPMRWKTSPKLWAAFLVLAVILGGVQRVLLA